MYSLTISSSFLIDISYIFVEYVVQVLTESLCIDVQSNARLLKHLQFSMKKKSTLKIVIFFESIFVSLLGNDATFNGQNF